MGETGWDTEQGSWRTPFFSGNSKRTAVSFLSPSSWRGEAVMLGSGAHSMLQPEHGSARGGFLAKALTHAAAQGPFSSPREGSEADPFWGR